MNYTRKVMKDIFWLGGNDRRLALFENLYPIPRGVSYNAYLVRDEKNTLFDTVDHAVSDLFLENLAQALAGELLHFVVVQHMEPDHCAALGEVLRRYPEAEVLCSAKAAVMIAQFFAEDFHARIRTVKEGEALETGRHRFRFLMAPMVHWPEVMVSLEEREGILFSADAFGMFGAINGALLRDASALSPEEWDEARRYYTNIVGKYGPQVQALLKKAAGAEIHMICPLHGPVWQAGLPVLLEKYARWSSYAPEEAGVLLLYGSVYGHTAAAMELLAAKLTQRGVRTAVYDLSGVHGSYALAEAFRYSHLVLASPTYNAGLFPPVEALIRELQAHNLQKRTVALVENGTWAPVAAKKMAEMFSTMKEMTILSTGVCIRSALREEQVSEVDALADALAASVAQTAKEL